MKMWRSLCVWLLLFTLLLPAARAVESTGPVYIIPVKTEISNAQFFFLRRSVKEAERNNASAIIIHLDTFGGEVKAALDNMNALLQTSVPTYAFIDNKAISAGALIALAAKQIYMTPTAVIGAAAPVSSGGEDLGKTMVDKTVSTLSALARGAAEKNGHNPALADSFIRKEAELKIGETVIDKPDTLLTLDARQATQQFDGKPLLAVATVDSLEKLLAQTKLNGAVVVMQPSGFEQLAIWLTAIAPLLMLGGILGAYIEIKTPGFGIAGIASVICFSLFFAANFVAGLAGQEAMILFLAGLILILAELFLHPGTVIPGVAGVLLVLGSLVWAMVDRYPSQPWWPSSDMLVRPLANLIMALLGATLLAWWLAKLLPRTSLYRAIVLTETTPSGAGRLEPASPALVAMGASGIARTVLRPSGKADFDGRLLDVVSQGEWINPGDAIRVVSVEGARVVVAPAAQVASVLA